MLTYDTSYEQQPASCTERSSVRTRMVALETTDQETLLHRIADDDTEAFEILYARYSPSIRTYLQRRLKAPDIVDEALNDVMLVIWQKATSCPADISVLAWLYGIARNIARQYLRRTTRPSVDLPESVSSRGEPEAHIMTKNQAECLDQAISKLPYHERQPIEFLVYHGYSYNDIAIRLGVPMNTIKTRMKRARERLATIVSSSTYQA